MICLFIIYLISVRNPLGKGVPMSYNFTTLTTDFFLISKFLSNRENQKINKKTEYGQAAVSILILHGLLKSTPGKGLGFLSQSENKTHRY